MKFDKCRSCKALIVWLPTKAGKSMPVDAGERSDVWHAAEPGLLYDPKVHKSHFATCPDSKQWKKPQPKGEKTHAS